ncbi:glycosyltransferase family 4 protein [Kordiimonas aestuarii]|uniref:glycosyltransferase family 4 protein n=1 Tax=Kordiimonas aestuarii TaxID=1005925 RepID=UPI0021D3D9ED|nr:glycosyltransferase family 4 protein [Kordiimonas aestuarii]
MKIFLHDNSGHPFQVQLSRSLAARGFDVIHSSFAEFQTPKGNLQKQADDPDTLRIHEFRLNEPFAKSSLVKRWTQERRLGGKLAQFIIAERPDVVIASNTPLDALAPMQKAAKKVGAQFIFWVQDIYSEAIGRILQRKSRLLGAVAGGWYRRLEAGLLNRSDAIVVISADFVGHLGTMGVDTTNTHVIENWAPLDEMVPTTRVNDWSEKLPDDGTCRYVYAGTLGKKHNPELLVGLARQENSHLYVFSEGEGADYLKAKLDGEPGLNMTVAPWVPFETLPKVLSSADVLVCIVEEEASIFCVPSKVLTYLCVGRPLLLAVPASNLASRIVGDTGAGLVAPPNDMTAFLDNARTLAGDEAARQRMGENGRRYALETFEISRITDRFQEIITQP